MSGIDSEDGRKSVEIQEYKYFLYFGRNGIVWFEDVFRKRLAKRKKIGLNIGFATFPRLQETFYVWFSMGIN